GPADLGQALRAEEQKSQQQEEDDLPGPDVRHGLRVARLEPRAGVKTRRGRFGRGLSQSRWQRHQLAVAAAAPGADGSRAGLGYDWATSRPARPLFSNEREVTKLALLELKNLHVALEDGTEIVKGVDLAVNTDEVHAIMGPNGSGKSTLAYALMGHPAYEITDGAILLDAKSVLQT